MASKGYTSYEMSKYPPADAPPPYASGYPPPAGYAPSAPSAPYPTSSSPYPPTATYAYPVGASHHGPPVPAPAQPGLNARRDPPPKQDKPAYRDVWALLLFIANLATFVTISAIALTSNATLTPFMPTGMLREWVYSLLVVAATATVLGILYTILMRVATKGMMIFSIVLSVALMVLYAIYCFIRLSIVLGILFLLFALVYGFVLYTWRHRIPFAVILVQTVMDTMVSYPSTLFVSFISIVFSVGFSVLFTFGAIYACNVWTGGALAGVLVYYVFGFYWTSQVIKNLMHTIIAGAFAAFYFFFNTPQMPANPVAESTRRACTYSAGSVCFGSLLVALVQTTHLILRSLARGHWVLECCINCIFGIIEGLLKYFNQYAFTQVAIYGKSYCNAGRDTAAMFKRVGLDAVANDNLVERLLVIAVTIVGWVGFGIGWAWAVTQANTNDYGYIVLFAFAGMLVAALIMSTVTETINSGVVATFVCLAEHPHSLANTRPELYRAIRDTYQNLVL